MRRLCHDPDDQNLGVCNGKLPNLRLEFDGELGNNSSLPSVLLRAEAETIGNAPPIDGETETLCIIAGVDVVWMGYESLAVVRTLLQVLRKMDNWS